MDRTGSATERPRVARRERGLDDGRGDADDGAPRSRAMRRRPAGHAAADRARAPARAAPAGERARRAAWRRPTRVDPEAEAARDALRPRELATVGRSAATSADEARARRPRPADASGRSRSTPAPARTCSRSRRCRRRSATRRSRPTSACPLQYAFQLRLPDPAARRTGRRVRVRVDRARRVRGVHQGAPRAAGPRRAAARRARTSSGCSGRAGRRPSFGDKTTEEGYQRRVATLLDNFWTGEVSSLGEALARGARLRADARAGRRHAAGRHHRLRSTGSTACRRAASRSSTTRPARSSRRRTSTRASSSRSTRSPAATRWASGRPSG